MRPRVFPAEDRRAPSPAARSATRFNEAAGIPRGRLHAVFPAYRKQVASMRPRVFPAEDAAHAVEALLEQPASMRPRVFPAEDSSIRQSRHPVAVLQ